MDEQTWGDTSDSPLGRLRRWELFGAHWQVLSRTETHLELALLTCDGGEEADRLGSDDPELIAYVGSRTSDQTDDQTGDQTDDPERPPPAPSRD